MFEVLLDHSCCTVSIIIFFFQGPDDYASVSSVLTFPVGTSEDGPGSVQCINISITDDLAYEEDESFLVLISAESEVAVTDPNTTVLIADNEGNNYLCETSS